MRRVDLNLTSMQYLRLYVFVHVIILVYSKLKTHRLISVCSSIATVKEKCQYYNNTPRFLKLNVGNWVAATLNCILQEVKNNGE